MFCIVLVKAYFTSIGFHGVMVSTQDSESCDPSSNLGGTYKFLQINYSKSNNFNHTNYLTGRDSSVGRALD